MAEISASAFRLARVAAFRGRYLLPEDERPDAPHAILIGHDEWVRRFGADPEIVGRSVQLGSTTYAVVGVMPEGFRFPLSPQLLDSLAARCRRVRAAQRAGRQHLRAPRAGGDARRRTGGAQRNRPASVCQCTGHARAPAPARHALHLCVQRHGRPRQRARALRDPTGAGHAARDHLRERGDSRLREDGDATRRDRRARRARREPAAHRRPAVRRSADPGRHRRPGRHRPGVGGVATTLRLGAHHRRRAALLDDAAPCRRTACCMWPR